MVVALLYGKLIRSRITQFFENMPKYNLLPSVVTYNCMMEAHGKYGTEDMLKYFEELKSKGIKPTVKTYNTLMEVFGEKKA